MKEIDALSKGYGCRWEVGLSNQLEQFFSMRIQRSEHGKGKEVLSVEAFFEKCLGLMRGYQPELHPKACR